MQKQQTIADLNDGQIIFMTFELNCEFVILRNNKQLINEFFHAFQYFEPNYQEAKRLWFDIEGSACARVNQHGLTEAMKELSTLIDMFRAELDHRKKTRPQDFDIQRIKEKVSFT
jgi:hypothetical protein